MMAILLVNIDNPATMALNEFYDYNGHCYALSCSRDREDGVAITFNDFYESTVATSQMSKIPVVQILPFSRPDSHTDRQIGIAVLPFEFQIKITGPLLSPIIFFQKITAHLTVFYFWSFYIAIYRFYI